MPGFVFKHTVCLAVYPSHMHLGDQLFHLPLIHRLVSQGISVHILGQTPLAFLFKSMGCEIRAKGQSCAGSVIITKVDCLPEIVNERGGYFLGLNYRDMTGDERIGDLIFNSVRAVLSQWISVKKTDFSGVSSHLDALKPGNYSWPSGPVLLVNDCVKSDRVSAFFRRKQLWKLALKMSKNKTVVFIGEASRRPLPQWVHYDYRGQIPIPMIFSLCQKNAQRITVVTFDTFIAHMGVLCSVSAIYTVAKRNKKIIKKRFFPYFLSYTKPVPNQQINIY
ncbi:hypothetical protein CL648_03755 [bacterium]|nr:hypothetical protein [bacterium]